MKSQVWIGKKRLKKPLIQGGMGIGVSLSGLAGAVAKEGGAGTISAAQIGFLQPEFEQNPVLANLKAMEEELQKARKIAPDGILGFNIMVAMNHYETYVRKAVETGADFIVSGRRAAAGASGNGFGYRHCNCTDRLQCPCDGTDLEILGEKISSISGFYSDRRSGGWRTSWIFQKTAGRENGL